MIRWEPPGPYVVAFSTRRGGVSEGPELGRVLAALLDEVIEEPARNTRETLLGRAREELQRA